LELIIARASADSGFLSGVLAMVKAPFYFPEQGTVVQGSLWSRLALMAKLI
jgi:hypothetical protein